MFSQRIYHIISSFYDELVKEFSLMIGHQWPRAFLNCEKSEQVNRSLLSRDRGSLRVRLAKMVNKKTRANVHGAHAVFQ